MTTEISPERIQKLTDDHLLARARALATEERRAGIALLHHLREIERRRLYAGMHGSLHEYVVRELGYSDGAAYRRISAMRLMARVPEVEQKLASGALSLSTASQVQSFIAAEKRITGALAPTPEVRALVSAVEGKSSRETEALLAARSPEVAARIRERPRSIDGEQVLVNVVLSAQLQEKLRRLRDRMAHANANPSLAEQLEMLADFALRRLEGVSPTPRRASRDLRVQDRTSGPHEQSASESSRVSPVRGASASKLNSQKRTASHEESERSPASCDASSVRGRAITTVRPQALSVSIRREVWRRAGGQCEQRLNSGERCRRTHRLQVDHRMPRAWGGGNELENLQLLCLTHNLVKSDRLPGRS